jgi:hypothetical protein
MDKVKQQAEQALAKAQQGVSQGQAKLDQVQVKRQADALLRNLGAAYYAQHRQGRSPDAVAAAMAALDEHVTDHGPIDAAASAPTSDGGPQPGTPATGPSEPSGTPQAPSMQAAASPVASGDFTIDTI